MPLPGGPRNRTPRFQVACVFLLRAEGAREVLLDLAGHVSGEHQVVERRLLHGLVDLSVCLPAASSEGEDGPPGLIAQLADRARERRGDLALLRDDVPALRLGEALGPSRASHDERLPLPAHIPNAHRHR